MTRDYTSSRAELTIIGSACLFAAAFWLLDAGSMLWTSNAGMWSAFIPHGSDFIDRIVYAAIFGLAGSIAGAALQRSRDIEVFAVDRLQEAGRKYKALMSSSFDCVITLDNRGQVVEMSESAAGLFNIAEQDMVGRSIDDFVLPARTSNEAGSAAGNDAAGATGNDALFSIGQALHRLPQLLDSSIAVTASTLQGRDFPAEVRITRMPGGGESAFVLAIRETTSSVIARKALQHSERRYQALFDNIPAGVYRSLADGSLLAANPAMARLLGYESTDELLREGNTRNFHADQGQRNLMTRVLEASGIASNVEFDLQRRDGGVVRVLANVRAVPSSNNEDVVYEGLLTDITDLLEAREALRDSEEHFRALCENSLDVISVIDADGSLVYSSPSSRLMSGRSPAEQVGAKLFRSVHESEVEEVQQIIRQAFERPGTSHNFTCRVYRYDGQLRYLEAVGAAFMTRDGAMRAVVQSRDVTERIEAEAEMREMQKIQVVGQMTGELAHDFNNLLTVISGNLELLDDRIADGTLQPHLVAALNACRQGTDLTRRLMAFANSGESLPEAVNINGVLLDLESVLRRSLGQTIELRKDFDNELWPVEVDATQFEAAILQLAVNARDAMNDNGVLTVTTRNCQSFEACEATSADQCAGDYVCICISDDGKGMDNDVLRHATEPFFTVSGEHAMTGLGLSVVKRFAEACGGKLRLSIEKDRGTTASLLLPRLAAAGELPANRTAPSGNERVLVVDDNVAVRGATAALLRSLGYDVVEADSGEAALDLLDDEAVDLLFTDVAMPRMSGLALARAACAQQPQLKVLLTSGNEAVLATAMGGQDRTYELIRKPFRKLGLAEKVRHVLDRKS